MVVEAMAASARRWNGWRSTAGGATTCTGHRWRWCRGVYHCRRRYRGGWSAGGNAAGSLLDRVSNLTGGTGGISLALPGGNGTAGAWRSYRRRRWRGWGRSDCQRSYRRRWRPRWKLWRRRRWRRDQPRMATYRRYGWEWRCRLSCNGHHHRMVNASLR